MGDILNIIDARILIYVLIAGGLTEGIMRVIAIEHSRGRWALLCSFGIAITSAVIDGAAMNVALTASIFRGLIAAAISNSGYDILKSLWGNIFKSKLGL